MRHAEDRQDQHEDRADEGGVGGDQSDLAHLPEAQCAQQHAAQRLTAEYDLDLARQRSVGRGRQGLDRELRVGLATADLDQVNRDEMAFLALGLRASCHLLAGVLAHRHCF